MSPSINLHNIKWIHSLLDLVFEFKARRRESVIKKIFKFQEVHVQENLGDDYEEESSSAGYHTDESCSPTPEPGITNIIARSNLSETLQNLSTLDVNVNIERLAERYGALYAHAHLHTLDALDALEPLRDAPELKAKILYSIVVVSIFVLESEIKFPTFPYLGPAGVATNWFSISLSLHIFDLIFQHGY